MNIDGTINVDSEHVVNCDSYTKYNSTPDLQTTNEQHDCIYCGKMFTHKEWLKHKQVEEKLLKCKYCELNFETVKLLRKHMYRYHKLYTCKLCDVRLLKGAYEYHMSSVHKLKPVCDICHKEFANKLSLNTHKKKIHFGLRNNKFNCKECDYKTSDKYQHYVHQARHKKTPMFFCEHCGIGQYTQAELKKHIQAYHEGGYPCDICQKTFKSSEYLKRHQTVHKPDFDPNKINFTCEECGKGFIGSMSFKKHLLKHKGQLPVYHCNICGKVVTTKASLVTHLRIHTGVKPFVCQVCGKKFSEQKYLNNHKHHENLLN